jgi:anhydro-N-acetylmuramic acid kinase
MKDVLEKLVRKKTRRVIGLMSGTSADGIDAALIEVGGSGETTSWELLGFTTTPFSRDDRAEILELQRSDAPHVPARLGRLHFRLGDLYAGACEAVARQSGYTLDEIDLAGLHGQTVFHDTRPTGPALTPATLQIGEAAVLAERTGFSVVHNFRARDVAAGGTGAPLVPYVDYLLFRSADLARLCINVGGIANFTAFPVDPGPSDVIAFDTGPGNMVIDALVEHYTGGRETFDKGGARAAAAPPDKALLDELMADEFILLRPPKSAGREQYGRAFAEEIIQKAAARKLSGAVAISTATSFTVRSIVEAFRLYVLTRVAVDEVLVSGGGVHNRTLMERLTRELAPLPVRSTAHHGLDPDAKEAVAFGILANESIHGRPGNLPSVTGAAHPVVLGSFVPGRTA